MLETAHKGNPDCNWWLKGDGCDLISGLGESMRLQWSGDVDLNTGSLQQFYQSYRSLLDFVSSLHITAEHLKKCSSILLQEKEFLVKGTYIDFQDNTSHVNFNCSSGRC